MSFDNINFNSTERFLKSPMERHIVLSGLLAPFDLFLIKSLKEKGRKVLFITNDEQEALKYQKDLKNLLKIESEAYPAQETGLYSETDKNYYIYKEQINILLNSPDVVFMPAKALPERFGTKSFYKNNSLIFKKNDTVDYSLLAQKLVSLGYKRTTSVTDIGEFALRGDILDIYTFDDNPVRIEFFADNIEDIRYFNPNTQKSFKKADFVTILPLYKFILDDKKKSDFIKKIKEIKTENNELGERLKSELIEKINETDYFEGIEYYHNYIENDFNTVLDYFSDYIVVLKETSRIFAKYQSIDNTLIESYNEGLSSNLNLGLETLNHTTFDEFKKELKKFKSIGLDSFLEEDYDKLIEFNLDLPPFFSSDIDNISKFIKKSLNEGFKINICSNYPSRLKEIFDELEIFSEDIFYFPDISSGGAISKDEQISKDKILFLTDKELFNRRTRDITVRKYYSSKATQDFIDSVNDVKTGEFVVHSVHGIGIYNGISKQIIDGNQKDYLEIQFQGTDKLFMPAEQINLLFRYRGSGGIKPKLSKMGGSSWETTKAKTKKEVEQIAYDLLDLYAKRKLARGIAFEPDSTWQFEMEDNFEYTETPDQLKAINDTKADMERDTPMDRLICADVGFGKTEIALRALFKAVMSGYQGIFIAPTTILTMQHYETLKERFEPFNVNIALLNRFCSKKEQKEIVEKTNNGTIDVIIGTHRLLSEDVKFKNPGLLVIDEEHKFGVRHKEKLKKLKENIDVLSLSATPIPRTLNMALSGIKDLSVINTPPKNRLPIKTYVGEFSETYVKNAINREIQRDGQVFYLYNRVETIDKFKEKLTQIVPNASIAVAHGQMDEKSLEEIICKFANREFDILLSTTIIESGLDIPNANTMIIHDCDKFGLAQLYQLRGRVGRSDRQAYCYCFYKKSKELNEQARKRLESIKDFSSLGSGYQIALRDIEIRGVGNLLGTRQHGQMTAVGFDTYCNLLQECINDLKNKKDPYQKVESNKQPAIVDINADAYIPDDWALTYEQKILEYKRISDVKTVSELENTELGLKDRFSKIPDCVHNLIKLVKLRILATNANIISVRQAGNQIRINTPFTNREWMYIKSKTESKYTRYFTYTTPPKTQSKVKGILLMNKNEDDFDEVFNKLADLFYHVSEIILNFNGN